MKNKKPLNVGDYISRTVEQLIGKETLDKILGTEIKFTKKDNGVDFEIHIPDSKKTMCTIVKKDK